MPKYSNKELKLFLESYPLYKKVSFEKNLNQSIFQITEIDSYCDICESERPFHDLRTRGGGAGQPYREEPKEQLILHIFTCVSCRKSTRTYIVNQIFDQKTVSFEKIGEMPRQKLEKDKQLEKFFSDDADNYHKAIVCLANGYGVAAFAYMRRIIENNIEKLLTLITEEIESTGIDSELLIAISDLRKESPMSEKIKFANKALPPHLKPDGLNPLGKLYQQLSEGVHSLPDAECLQKANNLKACIKFLISELSSRKQHRENFKKLINQI